jgi:hypothetical protein
MEERKKVSEFIKKLKSRSTRTPKTKKRIKRKLGRSVARKRVNRT